MSLLDVISIMIVLACHIAASIQDILTREIRDITWLPAFITIPLAILASLKHDLAIIYAISVLFAILFSLIAYALKTIGGADVISMTLLAFNTPPTSLSPPSIPIILNALLFGISIHVIYNITTHLRRRCDALNGLKPYVRIFYYALTSCVEAYRVLKRPNVYSLSQEESNGVFKPILRLGISNEDPRVKIVEWMSKGLISSKTPVLTSAYMPLVAYLTLGYIAYLLGFDVFKILIPTLM